MSVMRFVITRNQAELSREGENYLLPSDCLVITDGKSIISRKGAGRKPLIVDFYTADLQYIYFDLIELLALPKKNIFMARSAKIMMAEKKVLDIFTHLISLSPNSFLYFVYTYCLTIDKDYFSELLHSYISGSKDFLKFIDANFNQQYTVKRLAKLFGISPIKFNQLFKDNYGINAKRWLIDMRLKYAKKLLATTSMRITDIALESGFSSHTHFSDSFRRYFYCTPKKFRQLHSKKNAIDEG